MLTKKTWVRVVDMIQKIMIVGARSEFYKTHFFFYLGIVLAIIEKFLSLRVLCIFSLLVSL